MNDSPVGEAQQALGASSGLVIAEVYGGGFNDNAPIANDFVLLFNRGTGSVTTTGYFLQYAGTSNTFDSTTAYALPTATIPAGGYYLVTGVVGTTAAGTTNPGTVIVGDADSTTVMADELSLSSANGKVALTLTTPLSACGTTATPCATTAWVDFVGYGSAQQFEGTTGAAPTLATTAADVRNGGGCTDTDDNSADFTKATLTTTSVIPTSATTAAPCTPSTSTDLATTPADLATTTKATDMAMTANGDLAGADLATPPEDLAGADISVVHTGGGPQDLAHITTYPTQNGCSMTAAGSARPVTSWLVLALLAIPALLRRRRRA